LGAAHLAENVSQINFPLIGSSRLPNPAQTILTALPASTVTAG